QHQHQQNVHNSLSSPHSLYRISPTNNILGASIPCSKSSPTGGSGGYIPTQQTIINPNGVSSYFRIPALPVQQSQQQSCSFGSTSTGVIGISENSYLQGGIHTRIGTGQFPLRPNTSSVSSINHSIPIVSYSNNLGNASSSPGYPNPPVESSVRNIQHQHHLQKTQQQIHMPNNQNMNKNRYGNPQNNIQPTVNNTVLHAENSNNSAASNVKALIQQISHTQKQPPQQHQQQNVNNNVTSHSNTPPQNQNQPQYRIFKRGDSIPGISSPIQLSTTSANTSANNENGNPTNQNTISKSSDATKALNVGDIIDNNSNAENNGQTVEGLNGNNDKENSNGNCGKDASSTTTSFGQSLLGPNGVRTPLSQIGEIARFHSLNVEYRLVKETGPPHAPTFTVLLRIGNEEYTGEGSSIKKAQHAAAVDALEKTSLSKPPPKAKPRKPFTPGGGNKRPNWALIQLTAVAQELQLQLQFVQQPVPIVDPFRRGDPPSIVSVHVGDRIFTGEGINFNAAKNTAVMVALKAMMKVKQEMDLAKLAQQAGAEEQNLDTENKSPISIVHEMAMKRGLTVAFEIIQETGPPHMKVFTVKCKVGETLDTDGQGPTKQAGKKAAAELMIAKLKEIPITLPATSQGVNLKAMQRGLFRQKTTKKKSSTPVVKDLEKQTVSPISRLIQIAHIKKYKEPDFTLISTGTESNVENFLKQITERDRRMLRKKKPIFTIEVTVGPHTCRGTGSNKKAAKKNAAEAAIIALGYGPTETSSGDGEEPTTPPPSSTTGQNQTSSGNVKTSQNTGKSSTQTDGKSSSGTVKLAGARQIAPGVIVLKSENTGTSTTTSSAVAQEMKKVNTMTPCATATNREGIEKLAYLSKLLEISVSYSDFPKKNEYLSVVSLTTNPPHVAHGCGATLEEAQNAAALKILEELSTMGLDSVTAAAEKPSE
ncbi:Double-stranded RNA-binding protein Staufen 2, partial [Orchesella cincta]